MRSVMQQYDFLSSNGQDRLCERPCSTMEIFTG